MFRLVAIRATFLAEMFEGLATTMPLFAPMAAGGDPQAVAGALQ